MPGQGRNTKIGKITYFATEFWRPSRCPNELHDSWMEIMYCLVSRSTFSFQIGAHYLSQKPFLPRLLSMQRQCWKEGKKVFFRWFLALLRDQFCSKWPKMFCGWCPWNEEHEYVIQLSIECPKKEHSASAEKRAERCFLGGFWPFWGTSFAPNDLKFSEDYFLCMRNMSM